MYTKGITIMLIALTVFATIKLVKASPDTYYLEDGNILTTTPPSNPFTRVPIRGGSTYTNTWLSSTVSGNINGGSYQFTFWMNATAGKVSVTVSFTFGYFYNGRYYPIASASGSRTLGKSAQSYNLTANGGSVSIPEGSQLYLTVSIKNNHPTRTAYFYYSGSTYNTRIITPSIVVPEFPAGFFMLTPMLLAIYLFLRHCPKKALTS